MRSLALPSTRSASEGAESLLGSGRQPGAGGDLHHLGHKGKDLTMPVKFTLGMFLCALGFLTAAAAGMWFADARGVNLAVVYCAGLSVPESGRTVNQRSGAGDGCRAGAAASDGLYSGDVVSDPRPPLSCWAAMWRPLPRCRKTSPTRCRPCRSTPMCSVKLASVTLGVTVVMALMVPWLNRMINTPASAE